MIEKTPLQLREDLVERIRKLEMIEAEYKKFKTFFEVAMERGHTGGTRITVELSSRAQLEGLTFKRILQMGTWSTFKEVKS